MKKSIYYWSPCLTNIATVKATINSAISLTKYSNQYDVKIINVCGEWNKYKNYLLKKNILIESNSIKNPYLGATFEDHQIINAFKKLNLTFHLQIH